MKIHEYQAREILARYGLPVVEGGVATTPEQARTIAERMGRSENAVRNLLFRAMKELKKSFGDTESFHLGSGSLGMQGEHDGC